MLKIEESKRKELTEKTIVICTIKTDGGEADVIADEYESFYPEFEKVNEIIEEALWKR